MSAAIAATAAAVAMALAGGATDARLSDEQLVGQRLVVGFEGTQVPGLGTPADHRRRSWPG